MPQFPEQDGGETPPTDDSLVESGPMPEVALRRSGNRLVSSVSGTDNAGTGLLEDEPPPGSTNPVWVVVELPDDELGGAFATRLGRAGFKSQIHHPAVLIRRAVVQAEPLAAMMEDLVGRSATGAKMTVLNGLGEPSLTEILTTLTPMAGFVERLKAQWLMPYIVAGRLFARLQPVFTMGGELWGRDALARLTPPLERVVGADIVRAARELDLAQVVDRITRVDAFAALAGRASTGKIVVHASQATFAELHAFERSLVELGRAHEVDLARVVVNAPWSSCDDARAVGTAFHALRRRGVTLSVGGGPRAPEILGAGDIVDLLRELGAAIVRVPVATPDDALADVAQRLARSSVLVHATHVGDAATARAAVERGACLMSGEYFERAAALALAPR